MTDETRIGEFKKRALDHLAITYDEWKIVFKDGHYHNVGERYNPNTGHYETGDATEDNIAENPADVSLNMEADEFMEMLDEARREFPFLDDLKDAGVGSLDILLLANKRTKWFRKWFGDE